MHNRKLLVSVFNPQEAREAVLGGGRIIDSEDPRSALGNIKPRQIMSISDAVLNATRDLDVQLSTNIGEDQLLFDRSETGIAVEKSPYEIAGKAAQAAIGVAAAMGTRVHPCNLVKVGVDGMRLEMLKDVLHEVVLTLNRTDHYRHSQVMSVLFVQDMDLWAERRTDDSVRAGLVSLREFFSTEDGDAVFDLCDYAVNNLRNETGEPLFTDPGQVNLQSLIDKGVLPDGTRHTKVALNELFPHARYGLSSDPKNRRTTKEIIKNMVDATADAGADSIMLDTRIQTKVSRVSLVKTSGDDELIDINRFDDGNGKRLPRDGVLTLDEIRFFIDYCHYRNIEGNLAGSLQSYQAQQVWHLVPETDQMSTRGGSTGVTVNPFNSGRGVDSRRDRVTKRWLVRGLVPPEQGGCLNLPSYMKNNKEAVEAIDSLRAGYPDLDCFWVDPAGNPEKVS